MNFLSRPAEIPAHIEPRHFAEWRESCVDPEIVSLNVRSIEGDAVIELLLQKELDKGAGGWRHIVSKSLAHQLKRYECTTRGGWWASGLDPLNWQPMQWGQFKADCPRANEEKPGDVVKYDPPKGLPLGAYFLRVPRHIWQKVADRYEVPMPRKIEISPEGEALGFWDWVRFKNVPIVLTEGAKKAGCLLSLGYAAIACAGVATVVQTNDENKNPLHKPILRPCFQPFATEARQWLICFDFDKKEKTRRAVNKQIEKIYWHLIKNHSCEPKIVRLPGAEKGVDDFVKARGGAALDRVVAEARTLEEDRIRFYTGLSHSVSLRLNQRYVSDIEIPNTEKLVFIKSPKNTGKSTLLQKIKDEAHDRDIPTPVLVVTHRVRLGQATCSSDKLGLPFASEAKDFEEGRLFGCGMCVDSMHPNSGMRFDADLWYGDGDVVLVLDEVEQFIKHLLFANTEVGKHRTVILREFQKLIKNILDSEHGRIIGLDADLCDLSINFILGMAETPLKPWVLENHWKFEGEGAWRVHEYDQHSPKAWLNALCQKVEDGGAVFVFTESQKKSSTWSTNNLEQILSQRYPDKKILRIDSYSVADPNHPAYRCVADINEVVPDFDIVLASPTIGTGVSIDVVGHFKAVFGCFWGVSDSNSARQALARVREPVERHVWAKASGVRKIGRGETSLYTLLNNEATLADQTVRRIRAASESFDIEEGFIRNDTAINTWGKIAVAHNFDSRNYRANLLRGLEEEGHQIKWASEAIEDPELYEALTEIRDQQSKEEAEAIAAAPDISDSKAEELSRKKEKPIEDWHKQRKHELQKKYLVPVDTTLVERDRNKWFSSLQLHYYLDPGNPFLIDRDRAVLETLLQPAAGQLWTPTFTRRSLLLAVECLKFFKVLDLITPRRAATGYRNSDEDLIELEQTAKRHRKEIKKILNLTISEAYTPIKILQLMLGKLGLSLTRVGQEGSRGKGNRQWVYVFNAPDDGRDQVFAKWIERDALSRSQSAVHTTSIYINTNSGVHTEEGVA